MSKVATDPSNYQDIADAIRGKGVSGTFTPAEMAAAIASLPAGVPGVRKIDVEITSRKINTFTLVPSSELGEIPSIIIGFLSNGSPANLDIVLFVLCIRNKDISDAKSVRTRILNHTSLGWNYQTLQYETTKAVSGHPFINASGDLRFSADYNSGAFPAGRWTILTIE